MHILAAVSWATVASAAACLNKTQMRCLTTHTSTTLSRTDRMHRKQFKGTINREHTPWQQLLRPRALSPLPGDGQPVRHAIGY